MPKRNGAAPVGEKPSTSFNSIAEGNRQNAPTSTATSSKENTFSISIPNKNGPIVANVENHNLNNPNKHLAVIQENKVRFQYFNNPII